MAASSAKASPLAPAPSNRELSTSEKQANPGRAARAAPPGLDRGAGPCSPLLRVVAVAPAASGARGERPRERTVTNTRTVVRRACIPVRCQEDARTH